MLGTIKALLVTFKWLVIYVAFVTIFIGVLAGLGLASPSSPIINALVLPVATILAATFFVTRFIHSG